MEPNDVVKLERKRKPPQKFSPSDYPSKLSRQGYRKRELKLPSDEEIIEKIPSLTVQNSLEVNTEFQSINQCYESDEIFNYKPEKDFKFQIPFEPLKSIYNFKSKTFIPRLWGPVFREFMREAVKSCDFGAERGISYLGMYNLTKLYSLTRFNFN